MADILETRIDQNAKSNAENLLAFILSLEEKDKHDFAQFVQGVKYGMYLDKKSQASKTA